MEWLKQLPNWIKGTIASFTAVIGFITVFRSNVQLSVTVSVAMILMALFAGSLYAAFGKKQSDVSGEKSVYRFPDHRRVAFAGVVIIPLLSMALLMVDQTRNAVIIAFNGPSIEPMQLIGEPHNPGSLTYSFVIENNTNDAQYLDEIRVVSDVTPSVEKQEKCPLSPNATSGQPVDSVPEDPISVDGDEPNYNQTIEPTLGVPGQFAPAVPPKAGAPAGSGAPVETAGEYLIKFDVNQSNHNYVIKRWLVIPAHDYVSFEVSLTPTIEICEDWSSKISLVVKNTNGVSIQTEPLTINPEILDAAKE